MRFVPPVAALADGAVRFDGDPHARTRPMGEILGGLRGLGIEVDDGGRGSLPFTVRGAAPCAAARSRSTRPRPASSSPRCCSPGARYDEGVDVLHDGKPVPPCRTSR